MAYRTEIYPIRYGQLCPHCGWPLKKGQPLRLIRLNRQTVGPGERHVEHEDCTPRRGPRVGQPPTPPHGYAVPALRRTPRSD